MITQSAGVDERVGKLIVTSYSQTTRGLWIASGPCFFDADTDDDRLGNAIHHALSHSEVGVPHPSRDELAQLQREWLQALKVRSVNAYMKGTRSVALHTHDDERIAVTPTENRGRDGFVEIEDAMEFLANDCAPVELAAAVRAALGRATDRPASPTAG